VAQHTNLSQRRLPKKLDLPGVFHLTATVGHEKLSLQVQKQKTRLRVGQRHPWSKRSRLLIFQAQRTSEDAVLRLAG
jgi:hypothetical protein